MPLDVPGDVPWLHPYRVWTRCRGATCPITPVPDGAVRLFGERLLPVVSPVVLADPRTPLATPADLARHVLLHIYDPEGRLPRLDWPTWLAANGQPHLQPAGTRRFSLYDQVIQAAVAGQGVALGRLPLAGLLRDGRLVAPFAQRYDSARGYYALIAPHAHGRTDVQQFVRWLHAEARVTNAQPDMDVGGAMLQQAVPARGRPVASKRK